MNNSPNTGKSPLIKAFLEHRKTLAAYLAQHLLNPEDVDDILQETITRVMAKDDKGKILSLKSYLFIVARNLMSRQLKQQARQMTQEIEDLDLNMIPCESTPIDDLLSDEQNLKRFQACIKALPPQCRKVFLLRKVYGWPHKQIASHLEISTSTVERHITIALYRLDNHMKQGVAANPKTNVTVLKGK